MELEELPQDPAILLSYINTKLRDDYKALDDLCNDMHIERKQLEERMKQNGFEYTPTHNRFW